MKVGTGVVSKLLFKIIFQLDLSDLQVDFDIIQFSLKQGFPQLAFKVSTIHRSGVLDISPFILTDPGLVDPK